MMDIRFTWKRKRREKGGSRRGGGIQEKVKTHKKEKVKVTTYTNFLS